MPTRNQVMIRRGINRLNELVQREKETYPAFAAVADNVKSCADKTNTTWQEFQMVAVMGDKERAERDTAIGRLENWISSWRPVVILSVPGADQNIRTLPTSGATPDDVIRVGEDLVAFIQTNPGAESFRAPAQEDLGTKLDDAKKETADATLALPAERAARAAHTQACLDANTVLVRMLDVVRAIYGPSSVEYRQFMERASSEEEEAIDQEVSTGEEQEVTAS